MEAEPMHDDAELRAILRRIDRPVEPDPDFADALFAQLTAPPAARPGRGPMLLLAAALLVALLAAGAAVGSGLVELPWFSADATPPVLPSSLAEPTDAPSPSASATPSTTPSESADPTATATPELAELELGTMVAPVVDGVTLRESPGTGGGRIGTLARGSHNYVVDGPIEADGYAWYALSGPGLPPSSGCITPVPTDPLECPTWFGWAAAGDLDGSAWFEPTAIDCPTAPLTAQEVILGRSNIQRLVCFGSEPITFRAWWPELPGSGGPSAVCPAQDEPSGWLLCQVQGISYDAIPHVTINENEGFGGVGVRIAIDPASGSSMPARGTWVELRVHLDDPAAQGCDEAAQTFEQPKLDPQQYVVYCRAEFVLESAVAVAGP
jgi:hypothetical protein